MLMVICGSGSHNTITQTLEAFRVHLAKTAKMASPVTLQPYRQRLLQIRLHVIRQLRQLLPTTVMQMRPSSRLLSICLKAVMAKKAIQAQDGENAEVYVQSGTPTAKAPGALWLVPTT